MKPISILGIVLILGGIIGASVADRTGTSPMFGVPAGSAANPGGKTTILGAPESPAPARDTRNQLP